MTEFVVGDSPKAALLAVRSAEHDTGIFHPCYDTGHISSYRIGELIPFFGIQLDTCLYKFRRTSPGLVACRFYRVDGLSEGLAAAGKVDLCCIPYKRPGSCPGHIAGLVATEVPGQALFGKMGSGVLQISLAADSDGLVAGLRLSQPAELGSGQHFCRVHQFAGARDHQVGRGRNAVVYIPILQVELSLSQVRQHIPAIDIIVYFHAGVPLCDLIDPSILGQQAPHTVCTILRNGKRIIDLYLDTSSRCLQCIRQPDLHPGIGHQVVGFGRLSVTDDRYRADHIPVCKTPVGPSAACYRVSGFATGIFAVNILIELKP